MSGRATPAASSSSTLTPAEVVELSIGSIAAGGEGVGRDPSGRAVFVPRSAPGDRVVVEIVEARARWARGRAVEWRVWGPDRRAAPCSVYDLCGGCRLQHLEIGAQLAAKRDIVRETVRRIGGLSVDIPPVIEAPNDFGYRNRVTFTVRGEADGVVAGFRHVADPGETLDVEDCLLAEPAVRTAWAAVRENLAGGVLSVRQGQELRITVRGSESGDVDLLMTSVGDTVGEDVAESLATIPGPVGCHVVSSTGDFTHVAGRETLEDRWQGIDFELPPGVFLQVNRRVSSAMDGWLDGRVGDVFGRRVLDLYAGVGARAIRWAERGAVAVACEESERACAAGVRAAAAVGVNLEFVADRVEHRLEQLLPADLVVVNPPRAGLARAVTRMLNHGSSDGLAYVSCDPATLARDLGRLSETWELRQLQPFDAFPQTSHVETIAWLTRR